MWMERMGWVWGAGKGLAVMLMVGGVCELGRWSPRALGTWTALHAAARAGDSRTLAELLARGCEVDRTDLTGMTPLHAAAMSGSPDAVGVLLDAGADIDAPDRSGNTALLCALQCGQVETALGLIERGADVRKAGSSGRTPLHMAALLNELDLIGALLERGADANALDDSGLAPLNTASNQGHPEFVRELARWRHGAPGPQAACDAWPATPHSDSSGRTSPAGSCAALQ